MSAHAGTAPDPFAAAMASVARELLGEPNARLSSKDELRFGSRGSLCVDLRKGTFFDNEAGDGGGVIQLVMQKAPTDQPGALKWLVERKYIPASERGFKRKPRMIEAYDYPDEKGIPLFQVRRMEPKNFIQAKADGGGGWICTKDCMKGVRRVPYRLPELIKVVANGQTVFIAEGEKGVHSLESIGLIGTCLPGGAGKWRSEYNRIFADADVVVLPDNDPQSMRPDGTLLWHPDGRPVLPGQDHAADVAKHLHGVAARVRVLPLPDLPLKGDVAGWIEAGGTRDQLERLARMTPDWTPTPKPEQPGANSDDPQLAARQNYQDLRNKLTKNDNGVILPTYANLVLILKGDPVLAGLVEFNSFSGTHMLKRAVPSLDKSIPPTPGPYPRPWDTDDVSRLLAFVQKSWAHNFKKVTVEDCLLLEGRDNEVHNVRDYLASLRWDVTAHPHASGAMRYDLPSYRLI